MKWYFHLQRHTANRLGCALRTGFTDRHAAPSGLAEFCLVAPPSTNTCNYCDIYMQLLWQFCVISWTNTCNFFEKYNPSEPFSLFAPPSRVAGVAQPGDCQKLWTWREVSNSIIHCLVAKIIFVEIYVPGWPRNIALLSSYEQNITSLHQDSDQAQKKLVFCQRLANMHKRLFVANQGIRSGQKT